MERKLKGKPLDGVEAKCQRVKMPYSSLGSNLGLALDPGVGVQRWALG